MTSAVESQRNSFFIWLHKQPAIKAQCKRFFSTVLCLKEPSVFKQKSFYSIQCEWTFHLTAQIVKIFPSKSQIITVQFVPSMNAPGQMLKRKGEKKGKVKSAFRAAV